MAREEAVARTGAVKKRESGWTENPDYRIAFEASPRRVRVIFAGETVADTTRAMLMREAGHTPVYYFPREDVRLALIERTDHHTHCPYKGEASYFSLKAGGRAAENAVWSYEHPYPEMAAIGDYLAFYWDKVDAWFEEDDEIFGHPRDPYHRVDVVNSSRPVRVVLGGTTVGESDRARFLFETGFPVRYYLPVDDVRTELFESSQSRSVCPYKGNAVYFSARIGDRFFEDVAWSYPDPVCECPKIKGYISFFTERVDDIYVDGAPVEKVTTKWSRN